MSDSARSDPRVLRWAGDAPTGSPEPPWALAATGVLAAGERPVNNDDLIRLRPRGRVWRVGEATHNVSRSGVISVTLHLVEPGEHAAVNSMNDWRSWAVIVLMGAVVIIGLLFMALSGGGTV